MYNLGVDYGRRRIGLALSAGLLASPFAVIKNKGIKKTAAKLAEIIKQNDVGVTVIGVALHENGGESEISGEARTLGAVLQSLGIAVKYVDERWTSQKAEEILRVGGIKCREKIANLIDKVAASVILQLYLDNKNQNGEGELSK
jgi:putative Holliday junction resolvase